MAAKIFAILSVLYGILMFTLFNICAEEGLTTDAAKNIAWLYLGVSIAVSVLFVVLGKKETSR